MNKLLLKWLLSTGTAVLLALGAWVGTTLISHGQSIAASDAERASVIDRLDRIENKVDQLLGRNR